MITAQVSINTDGSNPDGSAILDLKSTTQGFLLPRMNTIQIKNISNPVAGLQVFNTDSSDFYGFNGNVWISNVHDVGQFDGVKWLHYINDFNAPPIMQEMRIEVAPNGGFITMTS